MEKSLSREIGGRGDLCPGDGAISCNRCGSHEYSLRESGAHLGRYCTGCGGWIKWEAKPITLERALDFVLRFGRHTGKPMRAVPPDYLDWLYENHKDKKISEMARLVYEARSNADGER